MVGNPSLIGKVRFARDTPRIGSHDTESNQKQFLPTGLLSQRDFTCPVTALIKHVDYFRCVIRPRQAHFRMFSSRKANTSGSQMFTPRWRKSCPSSTVWPMGG